MATVTLTPLHYYQVNSNNIITSIDPGTKRVKDVNSAGSPVTNSVIVEFAYQDSFRHKRVTDATLTFSGLSNQAMYDLNKSKLAAAPDVGDSVVNTGDGEIIQYDGASKTFWSMQKYPAGYSRFFVWLYPYIWAGSNVDFSFSSLTLKLTYQETNYMTVSMSPKTGFIDPASAKAFTLTATANNVLQLPALTGGTLYYKKAEAQSYSNVSASFTEKPYEITLPANTLESGETYDIYVSGTADDLTVIDSTAGSFTTEDGEAVATPVSPKNTLEKGTATFVWNYYNERGTKQYAYEIKYTADGGSEIFPTGKVVSEDTHATLTIPEGGTIAWSVRAYNQDDEAGAWSDPITFVNAVPPNPPTISGITQSGRPTISWICADQIAFQVQVLDGIVVAYDSGTVYSGAQQYTLKQFLPDGSYLFRVKIFNSLGYASGWAEMAYDQSFPGLPEITLNAEANSNGVFLSFEPDQAYEDYYLQRNGILIAKVTGTYLDKFPRANNLYTLIAVTSQGAAKFSDVLISFKPEITSIKTTDGEQIDASKRWAARVSPSKTIGPEYGSFNYIGADRPEIMVSKMKNIRYSFGFYDEQRLAESLIGIPVFYSDIFGNAEWCMITSVARGDAWYGNETTVELTAILYDEEISV